MEGSGRFHSKAVLPPGVRILGYPLDRSVGGPQSPSGRGGEGNKYSIIALAGNGIPVVQPVA